jgi:hypothetical protein
MINPVQKQLWETTTQHDTFSSMSHISSCLSHI